MTDICINKPNIGIISRIFAFLKRKHREHLKKKHEKMTLIYLQSLPEHVKKDIGWYDM